ncbi:ABC transporter ATP-binding protein, partial [Rhizobium ruizarguesonis]
IDGVIQGEAIRLVTAKDKKPDIGKACDGATLAPAPPRFEDAFIDMLCGGPGGRSRLAEAQQPLNGENDRPVIEAKGLTKRFGD